MSRSQKKFLYGILYLAIFGLMVYRIYIAYHPAIPEENTESAISALALQIEDVDFFSMTEDKVLFFAEILNPNEDIGALSFLYKFKVLDKHGNEVQIISGERRVYPKENRFISEAISDLQTSLIDTVECEISDVVWKPKNYFSKRTVKISDSPQIIISKDEIKITGAVENQSSLNAKEAEIIALVYDKLGFKLFTVNTFVTNLRDFEKRNFEITLPYSAVLAEKLRNSTAKAFVY